MKLRINRAWMACAILTFLLLLGGSSPLSADTVFSNLSGSFCNCGEIIQGAGEPDGAVSVAVEFTPSGNFTFTEAELGIEGGVSVGSLNVYLETISSTGTGTVIGQIGSDISVPADTQEYITADSLTAPITLSEGVSYWLVATAATADPGVFWEGEGTEAVPYDYSLTDSPDGPWSAAGDDTLQFAIDGTPVTPTPTPEPGTLTELIPTAIGVLGLGWWTEQRRLKPVSR